LVELRGVSGIARLDFGADVLVIERANTADIVVNPLAHQVSLAWQHLALGGRNAVRQLVSLNRKSPYALGFQQSVTAFYAAVTTGKPVDPRFSGAAASLGIGAIGQTLDLLPPPVSPPVPQPLPTPIAADIAVIGGTGFIGRALTRALVAEGHRVRVLSRGGANPFADLGQAIEMVPVALTDADGLRRAMARIDTVYHLAKAEEPTWEAYLENDVAVTERIAAAVLAAGVRRLVYTGTIASYDASRADRPITEATGFGPMDNRNLYARSKALCEARLTDLHRHKGLGLVIARPGIVVGPGGPLQHWGIGRWHGAGAVRIWGDGRNALPFVLVDDVADALVHMAGTPGIEGQSFNLIGDTMLSARDYFSAIHRLTNTRIRVTAGNLTVFYLGDMVKYLLKRHVLRRKGLRAPLLLDWKSRACRSPFRNDRAKEVLGWAPEQDAAAFARRAIIHPGFFGF